MSQQSAQKRLTRSWRLLLVLALLLPLLLVPTPPPAEAAASDVIPFLSLIVGWGRRNRVYRTVNAYIDEKRDYYDRLHATALRQLEERELGGLTESQVAAYRKVIALIHQEKGTMIDFAESEKRAARTEFIDTANDTLTRQMLATTPATRVLSAFGNGVRSSRQLIDGALEKLAGGGGGVLAEVQRARRIASRISIVGQLIGGRTGEEIRAAGDRIVEAIDRPTGEIEEGLIQVKDDLGELGDIVGAMQAKGYTPTVSEVGQDVLVSLLTGDEVRPAAQAIVDMLVAQTGGGGFRDRARDVVNGRIAVRCAARAERIRQVLFRLEMDIAGQAAGAEETELPACQAVDLGASQEQVVAPTSETEASAVPTPTPRRATATSPPPTTTPPPPAAPREMVYEGTWSDSYGDSGEIEFYVYAGGEVYLRYRKTADANNDNFRPSAFWSSVSGTHENGAFELPFNEQFTVRGSFTADAVSGSGTNQYASWEFSGTRER